MVTIFDPSKEEGLIGITVEELVNSDRINYGSIYELLTPDQRLHSARFLDRRINETSLSSIEDRLIFYVDIDTNLDVPLELTVGGLNVAGPNNVVLLYPNQPISALTYLGLVDEYPHVRNSHGGFRFPESRQPPLFEFRNEKLGEQTPNSNWGNTDRQYPFDVIKIVKNQARDQNPSNVYSTGSQMIVRYGK